MGGFAQEVSSRIWSEVGLIGFEIVWFWEDELGNGWMCVILENKASLHLTFGSLLKHGGQCKVHKGSLTVPCRFVCIFRRTEDIRRKKGYL